MTIKHFCGIIGDCADDLLGGGNAATLKDAIEVRDMLQSALDIMHVYISNVESNLIIADHTLDPNKVEEVCDFFYEGVKSDND